MTDDFGRDSWERRWEQVVRQQPEVLRTRPPSTHVLAEVADLPPGRALDAGCGHGAEAVWLAQQGWEVTGVDFSPTALAHAAAAAREAGVEARVAWVEADLGSWAPPQSLFDLVSCLYLHVAGDVGELVTRLAGGVAQGGTLLLVGHRPVDPETGEPTPAAGQVQVGVPEAVAALDPSAWQVVVAEQRRRPQSGSGVDAVVRAVRLSR